jgi:hypothetical protein
MKYKTRHYKQGFFKPKFPEKYRGDPTNIVYRSGWEFKMMNYCDTNSSIISWSSEEIAIPYISPLDNRRHRYFPDFYVEALDKNGKKKSMVIEIKPKKETREPVKPKRKTKQYITEVLTWGVNSSKWKAAQDYCLEKGWEFKIMTETELFNK